MPSYMCPYLLRTISESTLEMLRLGAAQRLKEAGLNEHLQLSHTVAEQKATQHGKSKHPPTEKRILLYVNGLNRKATLKPYTFCFYYRHLLFSFTIELTIENGRDCSHSIHFLQRTALLKRVQRRLLIFFFFLMTLTFLKIKSG